MRANQGISGFSISCGFARLMQPKVTWNASRDITREEEFTMVRMFKRLLRTGGRPRVTGIWIF